MLICLCVLIVCVFWIVYSRRAVGWVGVFQRVSVRYWSFTAAGKRYLWRYLYRCPTQTRTHTCVHTCAHARECVHMLTHPCAHMHAYVCMPTRMHTRIYAHKHTHADMHAHTHACTRTRVNTWRHTPVYHPRFWCPLPHTHAPTEVSTHLIFMHTHIGTYTDIFLYFSYYMYEHTYASTHTCVHTYTHAYIHACCNPFFGFVFSSSQKKINFPPKLESNDHCEKLSYAFKFVCVHTHVVTHFPCFVTKKTCWDHFQQWAQICMTMSNFAEWNQLTCV